MEISESRGEDKRSRIPREGPRDRADVHRGKCELAESKSLRIGIDGRAFMDAPTGVGRYVIELCRHLDHLLPKARFFVYAPSALSLPVCSERWSARIDQSWMARNLNRGLWLISRAGDLCRRDRLDVFWGAVTLLPTLEPRVSAVSTVHDLNHKIVPSTMCASDLWGRRFFFGRSLARANAILTNSHGTAAKLQSAYGFTADGVVQPGVSEEFTPQAREKVAACLTKYILKMPYLLAVGTREPRKNFELLVESFLQMKTEGLIRGHTLVLAGSRGWKDRILCELLERGASYGIIVLDYVEQGDLPALYTGAEALIFPSLYEGFGMPVLEARACGTRVIASDIPELREAGGDETVYVTPDAAGIREGIMAGVNGGAAAKVRAGRLPTWQEGAKVLANALIGERGSDAR